MQKGPVNSEKRKPKDLPVIDPWAFLWGASPLASMMIDSIIAYGIRCQEKSFGGGATPNPERKGVKSMRTPQSQSKHDSVVSIRAGELRSEGNRVWTDVNGYPKPTEVFGYIPDIVTNGQSDILAEVETEDSYSSDHTYNQLRAFDRAVNYQLEVVVPKSVYQAALNLYSNVWRVSVDSWRTFQ